MMVEKILNEIHNENAEVEIYNALSEWMALDRQQKIAKLARVESTIRAIDKIANNNPNKKDALDGIRYLCERDW